MLVASLRATSAATRHHERLKFFDLTMVAWILNNIQATTWRGTQRMITSSSALMWQATERRMEPLFRGSMVIYTVI